MNHTSIYRVFFMCLCNLNARFTPIFVKITLIPHLLMFYRIREKIKQSDRRNQVKRKLLICSNLLATAKEKAPYSERDDENKMQPQVRHGKDYCSS